MVRGKQTCKILKEIRRQIAEANGIEFATSECRYKGDCLGTCPKCEAEVRYLEQQLRARSLAGKAIALAGISAASLAMLMPTTSVAQSSHSIQVLAPDTITATRLDSRKVKGVVKCQYSTAADSTVTEALIGATVMNLTTRQGTATDIDGKFEIDACTGDSIKFSFVGYASETICVGASSDPIQAVLTEDRSELMGDVVVVQVKREENHYLDLHVTDENGNVIDRNDWYVNRVFTDEDGDENYETVDPEYFDDKHPCRIYWNYDWGLKDEEGNPLKEATLRIEAEGYDDPVTIKVKYPKHNAKKTIKFKHKKK